MLEYEIKASLLQGGVAKATANQSEITFDATSGRHETLPNPAELLLTSLAACMLKNVQRYSEILKFEYRRARVSIHATRNDNPPFIDSITYNLEIDTDIDPNKLEVWHKNILKFGTITNTLRKSTNFSGSIGFFAG